MDVQTIPLIFGVVFSEEVRKFIAGPGRLEFECYSHCMACLANEAQAGPNLAFMGGDEKRMRDHKVIG